MQKTILLIVLGVLLHFALMCSLLIERITRGMKVNCVGAANKVGVTILGFPLNIVAWIFFPRDPSPGNGFYIFLLLNSLFAVLIVWFVVIRPIVRRLEVRALQKREALNR